MERIRSHRDHIWSAAWRIDAGGVLIGRPVLNTQIYILDASLQPVTIGVPGEIYIAGQGVARGYWGLPGLTAERFLADPFSTVPGSRMYRTSDLGRWLSGGNIEFLGRNDHQVKLRGARIELQEIEAALTTHPVVAGALVMLSAGESGDSRLLPMWYPGRAQLWKRRNCGASSSCESLPDYMAPAATVC